MKIYKVYVYETAQEQYFSTKAKANKYIEKLYKQYLKESNDWADSGEMKVSLKGFIISGGIEITKVTVK